MTEYGVAVGNGARVMYPGTHTRVELANLSAKNLTPNTIRAIRFCASGLC